MIKDLYKQIIADKGTQKKDTVNNPLSMYLANREDKDYGFYSTGVIPLNLLFSGRFDRAIPIGKVSMISADSMMGKSIISLSIVKNAQKDNKDLITIIMDTERSFDFEVAEKMGIDTSPEKFIVFQENSLEEVKNIILKTVQLIPREERRNVLIIFDSWGTLVSSKTIDDGLAGKDVSDMTSSKKKNDLANILLNTQCTVFVINHVYANTGGFGDPLVVPGGKKIVFVSSSVILCTSRAKEKNDDKTVTGHIITAQTFKSRYSREKTVLQYRIKHDGGLDIFYGLLDDALDGGYVTTGKVLDEKETKKTGENVYKEKSGTLMRSHIKNDVAIKEEEIYNSAFWLPIFKDTTFKKYLEDKYQFSNSFDINQIEKEIEEINSVEVKEEVTEEIKKQKKVKK